LCRPLTLIVTPGHRASASIRGLLLLLLLFLSVSLSPLRSTGRRHSWHNWDSYIITYGIFCHGEFILLAVSAAVLKRFNQVQITRIKGLAGFYAVALLLLLL